MGLAGRLSARLRLCFPKPNAYAGFHFGIDSDAGRWHRSQSDGIPGRQHVFFATASAEGPRFIGPIRSEVSSVSTQHHSLRSDSIHLNPSNRSFRRHDEIKNDGSLERRCSSAARRVCLVELVFRARLRCDTGACPQRRYRRFARRPARNRHQRMVLETEAWRGSGRRWQHDETQ